MDSPKRTARLAGLLYVLASIPGAFAFLYVPGRLVVEGDATATADRIRASEPLLRAGIAAELVGITIFVFVALVLYRLFRPVSEGHALAMLVLYLVSVPISFIDILAEVAALHIANGGSGFLGAFDAPQRDALTYLGLDLHVLGIRVAQVFWGLWLFPFGVCVIRSRFIPRALGVLLMVAGVGHTAEALAQLTLPAHYADSVGRITSILTFGEPPMILWLLIFGARPQRPAGATPAPDVIATR
jgi:hypothetical protein